MSTAGKVRTQASSAHADAHGGDAAPRLGFSLLGRVEGGWGEEGGRGGSPCLCACLAPALTSLTGGAGRDGGAQARRRWGGSWRGGWGGPSSTSTTRRWRGPGSRSRRWWRRTAGKKHSGWQKARVRTHAHTHIHTQMHTRWRAHTHTNTHTPSRRPTHAPSHTPVRPRAVAQLITRMNTCPSRLGLRSLSLLPST
jgi:hypothetical protein